MDFVRVKERSKRGSYEIYPDFIVCRSKDLMVRGKSFYAIWDEARGMWSTDEYDVQRMVDAELWAYKEKMRDGIGPISVCTLSDFSSSSWAQFRKYINNISDNYHQLDERLTFANTPVKKEDYVSKRLPYSLEQGSFESWDELVGTLYEPEERAKLEWAIGSIVSGDSRDIQKFIVLYGEAGTGKSTILNIVQKLFDGYYTTFEAKALTQQSNQFSTEVFRTNPLVAIQHDGDLSHIEDNSKLNSIISHEEMTMNEKFKATYTSRTNCFLFMGTNRPVKITDAKSGIIRRLIDVTPSGKKIPSRRYHILMDRINFELGAIAAHCLDIYKEMGKNYYDSYKPLAMIYQTDVFFNFVESCFDDFSRSDGVTLTRAYDMYKRYCDEALVEYKLARHKFREELKNYFERFEDVTRIEGHQIRSWYSGFLGEKFANPDSGSKKESVSSEVSPALVLECTRSIFDEAYASYPAQYATEQETPVSRWSSVRTTLADLDTSRLHYVKVPKDLVVIDFDIRGEDGKKDKQKNLEAASKWPATYAEFSKSGAGVHLHYIYDGDVTRLKSDYAPGIEVKVFTGGSSLRRKLGFCNDIPIAHISTGLPLKEEKKVLNQESVKSEKSLRELILRNLRKEIHPGTKPSMDFIKKILDDAYASGLHYDVSDMRQKILIFAMKSTNHADYCMALVKDLKLKSEDISENTEAYEDTRNVFFDVEVFPNLFVVCWKIEGSTDDSVVKMINPTPSEIEDILKFRLIGFNNRKYDNHILYGRYLGYSNEELYNLSQRIISGESRAMFGEAYNLSYTDVYDFSSKKQSLKKFEIELGIHHQELGIPWDISVPEELWPKVAEYCCNDVIATEATFKARKSDWVARQILADVAGMTVNDTTNQLTTRIIFGSDKNPQTQFNYRNLGGPVYDYETLTVPDGAEPGWSPFFDGKPIFPGYKYEIGKSIYRGEEVGEGGYVYAEPGVYYDVALLDIASMHPSSIVAENLFGDRYTARFKDILDARVAIKHGDFDKAKTMLDGKLAKYLDDKDAAKDLAQALKIAINSVYGLTSAKFDNPFRDIRNFDNIVAKRGALFMVNLKHEVQRRGYTVAHIKTDSIKIPNATNDIIQFVMSYGKMYGYNFEHEDTYERMCLVNDAVYIAKYKEPHRDKATGKDIWWNATGAQFQQPYVYKKLFSKEDISFADLCETKSVSGGALYLDMNEGFPDVSEAEKELAKDLKSDSIDSDKVKALENDISKGHDYHFVGKTGLFTPIISGFGGGILLRENKGKYYSVSGSKGYRWLESEEVKARQMEGCIDERYYESLCDDAKETIGQYYDYELFASGMRPSFDIPPWSLPCGDAKYSSCLECPHCKDDICDAGFDVMKDIVKGGESNG